MNLDAIFTYVVNNSVMITQWLVVCVFATSILYIGFRLFAKEKLESPDFESSNGLRGHQGPPSSFVSPLAPSVDEIMAQPGMASVPLDTKAPVAPLAGVATGAVATSSAEILAVTQELTKKEAEIRQLREQMEAAKSSNLDASALKAKIEELQGKLAEYEILEDDIADLSKFKEENAKLKAELEALKNGALLNSQDEEPTEEAEEVVVEGSMEEPESQEETLGAPVAQENDEDPISKDDLMAQFEATLEAESSSEGEPEEEAKEAEPEDTTPVKAAGDDEADFVAEFEAAVQQQKVAGEEEEENEEATQMPTGDDILAEFAESLSSDGASTDSEGDLNTDKMLAEMADLGEGGDEGDESALEQETDTEKMAREASRLLSGEE